jgi:ribosome biogenesis GTPase
VTAAVHEGRIPEARLASYRKLVAELEYLAARDDPALGRERRRAERVANRRQRWRLDEKHGD